MQNIKRFTLVEPTDVQKKKFTNPEGVMPQFLCSEDGQDWYECQELFSEYTIKVMYDKNNVVRSVVDKPLPGRGNIFPVSAFFPLDMSVAEVEGPLPEGFNMGGGWVFNGVDVVPRIPSAEELVAIAETTKVKLIDAANKSISPLQDAVDLDMATDEETAQLQLWKKYRVLLSRVDTSEAPVIEWPITPY
ncbi:tail fiber assembly protein [Escherichia sp. E1130]|uniref:tail fiber assembly protein n=1 Tax=Escherichia sp. E1130 TaxID=2041645 RepID=UPI0010FD83CB|nr:tail fiber assembly protein [Escherichia sp. E1130]TLI63199.1 tail fiber assembly protein [Escherichia sp. E1130]